MGDIRTTTGEKLPATTKERNSRLLRNLLVTVGIIAAVVALGCVIRVPRYAPASGYATTFGYSEVRSAVAGRVVDIPVRTGDTVKAGDVLVRLEDDAERAAVAEAKGQVAKAEAELALREATAAEALRTHAEDLLIAEMNLAHAREQLEVTKQLHAKGLASGRALSDDTFAVKKGDATLSALRAKDTSIEGKQLVVLAREVETRRDALARAEAALADRTVRAPIDGRVSRYTFYVGEMIRPDMVLYEVFDGEVNTLKLRIPERYASRVKAGMPLEARLGTHQTLLPTWFDGKVALLRDIVEGDGTSNYRVAYCDFDRGGRDIAPGTSANVRIRTGSSSLWMLIFEP